MAAKRKEKKSGALSITDLYRPFPRQKEFHDSPAKYRLFGGAAGPGKTKALLWEAIHQANQHPGVDTLLLRRTFPELEASLITYFRRDVPRELYEKYNDSQAHRHLAERLDHALRLFGERERRLPVPGRGISFHRHRRADALHAEAVAISDQPQSLPRQRREAVHGRRDQSRQHRPRLGEGAVGRSRPAPGMDRPEQYDPDDYEFIHATIADNPIYADDADYQKTLEALPRQLRRAFLIGEWDVYAGQYFDIFDVRRAHRARRAGGARAVDAALDFD